MDVKNFMHGFWLCTSVFRLNFHLVYYQSLRLKNSFTFCRCNDVITELPIALHAGCCTFSMKMADLEEAVATGTEYREWSPVPVHVIIRAPSENDELDDEYLEEQLEDALDDQVQYIIIEPEKIGNETTKWIQMGNFLHKTGVLSGLGTIITGLTFPQRYKNYFCIPMGVLSLSCITLYNVSWQYDPCCKYQVEENTSTLEKLEIENLKSSVVVLKKRDDKYRKRLHNMIGIFVIGLFTWKVYKVCS